MSLKKRVNTDAMRCNANDAMLNCFHSKYTSGAITN